MSNYLQGQETEVNAAGPQAEEEALQIFYRRLEALTTEDYVVLSGSLLPGMPCDSYRQIMQQLQGRGVHFIVDTTGESLRETLPLHPFLIKPNQRELEELFKTELTQRSQVAELAKQLQEMGAENVLVSLGGDGAVCVAADGRIFDSRPPGGKVVNSVGAGDSMVAGFCMAICRREIIKWHFWKACARAAPAPFRRALERKNR